jgi:rare lipoprotein A (peptidoglycan hydrolase)
MRTAFHKTALLVLLASSAYTLPATGALAEGLSTGGASSPSAAAPVAGGSPHKSALATWFGPGFYGHRTACGQLLTPAVLGLANRTLPCGTLVDIVYRGRRLTLPVIDRGPYGGNGARWDLTFGAARALGMADTARIAARVVGSARNTPALGAPPVVHVLASSGALTGGISAG